MEERLIGLLRFSSSILRNVNCISETQGGREPRRCERTLSKRWYYCLSLWYFAAPRGWRGTLMIQGFLTSVRRWLGFPSHEPKNTMIVRHRLNDDGSHQVDIHALRVLLFREGDHWIAQGLDLDYATAGKSIPDVQRRFAEGLCHTLTEYAARDGSLEAFIRPAPREIWQKYYRLQPSLETSMRELPKEACEAATNFRRLAFLQEIPA